MKRAALTATLFAAALSVGCSGRHEVAPTATAVQPIPGFNIASRTAFDGRLLKLESGAMFGLIESRRIEDGTTIHAELMSLQRWPTTQRPGESEPVLATSQVYELDCGTGLSRVIGNVGYARSGEVLTALPISVPPSRWAATVGLLPAICDGAHEDLELHRFHSISEFLDLFDQVNTPSPPLDLPQPTRSSR